MTLTIGPIILNPATHCYCAECGVRFEKDYEQVVGDGDHCWHLSCAEAILRDQSEEIAP